MITINNGTLALKTWDFPAGERGCSVTGDAWVDPIVIKCNFTSSTDIIDILLVNDTIRHNFVNKVHLVIPYFPFARQDRRVNAGDPHSMKVIANVINSCKFDSVIVNDPHSDVVEALVDNLVIIPQEETAYTLLKDEKIDILLAPDAGASKKIYKLAAILNKPVIIANKERELSTGRVIRSIISDFDRFQLQDKHVWIVDDICDGGASFLELAKVLHGHASLNLYVTHGIFSKGKEVFDTHFSKVICHNDMSCQ